MHFEPAWHAQGLRWIASLLETTADALERPTHESLPANDPEESIEEARLRVHLRGL
jgi:hypothetical protein